MLEIVTMNVARQREGIGRDLVEMVCHIAETSDCTRVWVITTNDNRPAMAFYKAVGFTVAMIHKGVIEQSRKLKPEIPMVGIDGIPITDEVELERILGNT